MDLREKIVKLSLTIPPPLGIPDKDKVLEVEGEAKGALKTASTQADYSGAVKLFQKALLLAPWDADLNYNLAKAQEMAKQYDDAIASYRLYLLAAPNAKDHDAVVEKLGELKYEAKQDSPEAIAERNAREAQAASEKKQQDEVDFIKNLDGTRYACVMAPGNFATLDIQQGEAMANVWFRGWKWIPSKHLEIIGIPVGRGSITARRFTLTLHSTMEDYPYSATVQYTISENGSSISGTILSTTWPGRTPGEPPTPAYLRRMPASYYDADTLFGLRARPASKAPVYGSTVNRFVVVQQRGDFTRR